MNKRTSILYLLTLSLFFTSCIKDEVKDLTDEGTTFVKFLEAPTNAIFFSPFTEIRKTDLFSMRKDANSNAELQTPNAFKINADPQMVTNYNNANGTDFEILPDSLYSVDNANFAPSATGYTVNFAGGVFAQEFTILLDGSKWDLSKKYALAFRISDPDGRTKTSGKDSILVLISIKNKYDGRYQLTGYHNRVPYNFPYDQEIHLLTVSATEVAFYWPAAGSLGHPIGTGPDPVNDVSWYGPAISPVIVFDPVTDLVTNVYNVGGATPITMFTGAGSRLSEFRSSDHSVTVDWNYNNNPLRAFFDDLKYLGPR